MADIDAFFKNRDKKKKSKKTKVLTATDLFKEEENGTSNQNLDQKPETTEDEWLEATGEQDFVIENVKGLARLELEERTPPQENLADEADGNESDEDKGETSWKNSKTEASENAGLPGDNRPQPQSGLPEAQPSPEPEPEKEESKGPTKYIPVHMRMAQARAAEPKQMSYRRREKIDIESQADFPTLGAAADTTPEGFEQVAGPKAGRAWSGSAHAESSTGISNRFAGLQNH